MKGEVHFRDAFGWEMLFEQAIIFFRDMSTLDGYLEDLKKAVIGLFSLNFDKLLKAYVIQFNGKAFTSIEVSMSLNANT